MSNLYAHLDTLLLVWLVSLLSHLDNEEIIMDPFYFMIGLIAGIIYHESNNKLVKAFVVLLLVILIVIDTLIGLIGKGVL